MDVALSGSGDLLFIADYLNHTIRCLDVRGETVHTLKKATHDAKSCELVLKTPSALCLDDRGCLYVACKEDHTIRKLLPAALVRADKCVCTKLPLLLSFVAVSLAKTSLQ